MFLVPLFFFFSYTSKMDCSNYLRTTEDTRLPSLKKDVKFEDGLNGARLNAFRSPDFFVHPVYKKAVETVLRAKRSSTDMMLLMLPADTFALMQLQNQICSSCRAKGVQLYTCMCCSIFQVCSKECLEELQQKNPSHGTTLHRFV